MTRLVRCLIAAAGVALTAAPAFAHEYRGQDRECRGEERYQPSRFERARREERREIRELEYARDHFYARWNGSPWSRSRFDGWYARRRAEIRQRFAWLERERWR